MSGRIPSVVTGDNGDVIAAIGALCIGASARTIDLTYGRGVFWSKWRPSALVTNDLDPEIDCQWHDDFRDVKADDAIFDAVVFDPPYVSVGGRRTSTTRKMGKRYAMLDTEPTPALQHERVIAPGIREAARLACPFGRVLVKCSDYVSSGTLQMGSDWVRQAASDAGLRFKDYVVHHSGLGPQPLTNPDGGARKWQHTHRAHSFLLVFEKRPVRSRRSK